MDDPLLAVALLAPLVAGVGSILATGPETGRRAQQAGLIVAAVAWAALAARGRFVAVGWFHTTPLLAAASCGAVLLAAADDEPATRRSLLGAAVGVTALLAGLAAGERQVSALPLLGGLIVGAVCALGVVGAARDRQSRPAVAALIIGIALIGGAFVGVHESTGAWELPLAGSARLSSATVLAFLAGAAALVGAGTLQAGRAGAVFLAAGLAVGLLTAPLREVASPITDPGAGDSLFLAVVVLGVAAVMAAAAGRAVLALGLLGLAVAAAPVAFLGASRLLAAASVLILAVDRRPAWLLGVPGAVAVAVVAAQVGGGVAVGLGVATGAVAALLGLAATGRQPPWRRTPAVDPLPPWGLPDLASLPAVAAGAWLLVAPATWSWTGPAGLDAYDSGAARATAAGLIGVLAVVGVQLVRGGTALRPAAERPERPVRAGRARRALPPERPVPPPSIEIPLGRSEIPVGRAEFPRLPPLPEAPADGKRSRRKGGKERPRRRTAGREERGLP